VAIVDITAARVSKQRLRGLTLNRERTTAQVIWLLDDVVEGRP